jgi:hypothetical protein
MEGAARRVRLPDVLFFLLGACAAPFFVVGVGRLSPHERPLTTPFVVVVAVAGLLWGMARRAVAAGLAVGAAAFAVFLYILVSELEEGLRGFD